MRGGRGFGDSDATAGGQGLDDPSFSTAVERTVAATGTATATTVVAAKSLPLRRPVAVGLHRLRELALNPRRQLQRRQQQGQVA